MDISQKTSSNAE